MRLPIALFVIFAAVQTVSAQESAQTLIERGQRFYDQKDYTSALADFEAAYTLDPRPVLLYARAQCHRLQNNCEKAIPLYEKFLATSPKAEQAAGSWEHIATCR